MSSIVPPLDYIPKLPAVGVNLVIQQLNKLIDELVGKIAKLLQEVIKLPDDIKCDDERILAIKRQVENIMKIIQDIQKAIPKIQKAINTIKQIVNIAKQIKNAITIAQMLNPITAPAFIAGQLMLIQDATIVNAVDSLKQFQTVPSTVLSKLSALIPQLLSAVSALNLICNGDEPVAPLELSPELLNSSNNPNINSTGNAAGALPLDVKLYFNDKFIKNYSIIQTKQSDSGYWLLRVVNTGTFINSVKNYKLGDIVQLTCPAGQIIFAKVINVTETLNENVFCLETTEKLKSICSGDYGDDDYNDLVETEFYNEFNVSVQDLEFRSDTIEDLLRQQQDLLKSLQEAPSKVLQGVGAPSNDLGKVGDYYIDMQKQQIYGPKTSINSWT